MATETRFWTTLDSLSGLAAVRAEWCVRLGDEIALVDPFLCPRPRRAVSYPRLGSPGLPYRVVEHSQDDIVAVCDETGNTIPLTKADLIVHEVERRGLAGRLADAFGLERNGPVEDWDGQTIRLGQAALDSTKYATFLTFPAELTDVHFVAANLIADGQAPFILMCPTRRWLRRAAETTLRANACVFVSLRDSVIMPLRRSATTCRALRQIGFALGGDRRQHLGRITGRSVTRLFSTGGRLWTVTFARKTIRSKDSLGLKCIAYLISKSRQHIDALVLKAVTTGKTVVKPAAGMEVLDPEAFQRYKAEHDDLCEQLEEAERNNDFARQEQIQKNLDAFTQQINSATGLGGRQRKNKDHVENARISLTNAINRAIQKISDKKHFDLARHIQNSICTGRTFQYSPEVDVNWDL